MAGTALIGDGQPVYSLTPGDDVTPVVAQAIGDGKDELIFTDNNYAVKTQLDLDNFAVGSLSFIGAGPHITHWNKNAEITLVRSTKAWNLTFQGIEFFGENFSQALPLCEFLNFQSVKAVNAAWIESDGPGLKLQSTNGVDADVTMVDARFDKNARNGLILDHIGTFDLLGCMVQRNADGTDQFPGLHILGSGSTSRTIGTVRGLHCELNGSSGQWAVRFQNLRNTKLLDSYLYESDVELDANTSDCSVENCARYEASIQDVSGNNTLFRNKDMALITP